MVAITDVYERFFAEETRYVQSQGLDRDTAEEIVQQAIVDVLRSAAYQEGKIDGRITGYLHTAVKHDLLNHWEKERRRSRILHQNAAYIAEQLGAT